MLAVKDAAKMALTQLNDVLPRFAGSEARLEEVELEELEDRWTFTFSVKDTDPLLDFGGPFGPGRIAKTVSIRASDGQLLSVKQRKI